MTASGGNGRIRRVQFPAEGESMAHPMKALRIFETVLYAEDLAASRSFFGDILGLEVIYASEILVAFRLPASVLLVFDPRRSNDEGRSIPRHGSSGAGHVAFACPATELSRWKAHLESRGIEIERIHEWPEGGTSLYIRDPAGNSIEFAPPTLWGGGWDFSDSHPDSARPLDSPNP